FGDGAEPRVVSGLGQGGSPLGANPPERAPSFGPAGGFAGAQVGAIAPQPLAGSLPDGNGKLSSTGSQKDPGGSSLAQAPGAGSMPPETTPEKPGNTLSGTRRPGGNWSPSTSQPPPGMTGVPSASAPDGLPAMAGSPPGVLGSSDTKELE